MILYDTCLREFIQPVPLCLETVSLTIAFERLCQSGGDRLVLTNPHHYPVGLVRLPSLLTHLAAIGLIKSPLQPIHAVVEDLALQSIRPSIVEPLTLLPDDLLVEQVLPHLQPLTQSHIALTNQKGEFEGLLDTPRLLQALAANLTESIKKETIQPLPTKEPSGFHAEVVLRQQRQIAQLTQQLLAQKNELEAQVKAQQDTIHHLRTQPEDLPSPAPVKLPDLSSSLPLPLQPLLQLFECLPLPLMLQTSDGQVVAQNSVWRQQIGELTNPRWIRQAAAALLETLQPEAASHSSFNRSPSSSSFEKAQPSELQPFQFDRDASGHHFSAGETEPDLLNLGLCHLGTTPGSCVCVCPLKNGQEQVLQFIKVPIGILAPQLAPALTDLPSQEQLAGMRWQSLAEHELPQSFRLATLAPSIDLERQGQELGTAVMPAQLASGHLKTSSTETLWLVLAQDITEQEQLAKELTAKNADLVQLNRLKDEFLACISHELRTPLTAILGLSSLLKDQTLGELNQRQVHYTQLIYQSGRHLMAVVNDILDLTRTETGQLELDLEPVDILAVCQRAFDQAKQLQLLDSHQDPLSDTTNLLPRFSLEIEPGIDRLIADELRLRQMLIHLLANALKFTESGQEIGLRVGAWSGWIAFTVWDTGIGIPTDKQHLIFQKFQQLENPLTRRYEGTGLGLVLAQRLARLHGGDVTFISKEGQGSQFTILLPPSPPDVTPLARGLEPDEPRLHSIPSPTTPLANSVLANLNQSTSSRNQLVLIVEAVPSSIESLSDQLTGLGYRVVIARSGTEAWEKARRLQPCIIFLNPVLPLLSGWDVLTLLKSNLETQKIPVVLTATQVDEAQAAQRQADGLLNLPIQPKALQQSLQQLIVRSTDSEPQRASVVLTVLRLSPGLWIDSRSPSSATNLDQLLHSCRYRVVEADDLEQAELLARVWKPNVVLLDGSILQPIAYFEQFRRHTVLASLPLVTIEQATTQAANQLPGLLVFPCLATVGSTSTTAVNIDSSALLQVIQVAAGYAWKSSILALDIAALPVSLSPTTALEEANQLGNAPQELDWLQALTQYLQTAGFRSLVGRSWQEVLQQVQSQSIDLLLICWTDAVVQPGTLERLTTLQQLVIVPPMLVLDHRSADKLVAQPEELPALLHQMATRILPRSLPMADLLNQIQQAITR